MAWIKRVYVASYHCFELFFFSPSTFSFLRQAAYGCCTGGTPAVHAFSSHSSKMEQLHDLRMLFHPERLCPDFQMCVAIWQALTCLVGIEVQTDETAKSKLKILNVFVYCNFPW